MDLQQTRGSSGSRVDENARLSCAATKFFLKKKKPSLQLRIQDDGEQQKGRVQGTSTLRPREWGAFPFSDLTRPCCWLRCCCPPWRVWNDAGLGFVGELFRRHDASASGGGGCGDNCGRGDVNLSRGPLTGGAGRGRCSNCRGDGWKGRLQGSEASRQLLLLLAFQSARMRF
jgi:hypothetical protein